MIGCLLLSEPVAPSRLLPRLAAFSPTVEAAGPVFFLDLGGLAANRPAELLDQLHQAVRPALPGPPRLGLAAGKFPARIAAASLGPGRGLVVAPGCEAGFLHPLPIDLLPLDDELARQFGLLGLATLGHLADLPAGAVLNRFGRPGRRLQQLARGRDARPVVPFQPAPVERLTRHFETPLADMIRLERVLQQMIVALIARLQANHLLSRSLQLDLTLANGDLLPVTIALRRPTQEPDRLLAALSLRLARLTWSNGVIALRVTLADLQPVSGRQPSLFETSLTGDQQQRLRDHLPALLRRFGPARLFRITLSAPEAYLLERRFTIDPLDEP